MNYKNGTLLLTGVAALTTVTSCDREKKELATKDMNVVFILTDDQGYGDLGFTGNPYIKTPNIDKLAGESYRFTNYHTCTNSAPTRSGIMSGKYNNRVGVWHTVQGRELLSLDNKILPEVFSENGYTTAMFGKWHLGDNYPYRPFDRGFAETLWHHGGGIGQTPDYWNNDYFDDNYYANNKVVKQEGYCTDIFFDAAKKFITRNKDNKFFCYISTNAPHAPHNIAQEYVEPYLNNPDVPNARFCGMIANIDENVGQLDRLLSELGIDDNTIVIFSTDNGSAGGLNVDKKSWKVLKGYNAEMRGRKGCVYEGGHRTPFTVRIPGEQPFSCDIDELVGYIDIAPTLYGLCGLKSESVKEMDGIDFSPIFDDTSTRFNRSMVIDTQREEFLSKTNPYCVIKDQWRLINGDELYDIKKDVGQEANIAEQYPEKVEELKQIHSEWWGRVSVLQDVMQRVPLTAPDSDYVQLNSHDRHDADNGVVTAEQRSIRAGVTATTSTFWATTVTEEGRYRIELLRWPLEANLPLTATAPKGDKVPNGKAPIEGVAMPNINGGELIMGNTKLKTSFNGDKDARSIIFDNVNLKKGDYDLYANFSTDKGSFGAQYVVITKL